MDRQTLYILITLIAVFIALWLAYSGWRRRGAPGSYSFVALMLIVAELQFFYALELASDDRATIMTWSKFQYIGLATIGVGWMIFAVYFTHHDHWLTRERLLALLIIPAITITFAWTNEWHQLIWETVRLDTSGAFPVFDADYGPWFWVNVIFSYVMMLIGSALMLQMARNSWRLYRNQSIAILASALVPWITNFLDVSGLSPFPGFNPMPVGFTIGGVCLSWAMRYFSVFEIVPIAYDRVIESMSDGVLVLDMEDRILTLNPTMSRYLQVKPDEVVGKKVSEALRLPQEFARFQNVLEAHDELEFNDLHIDLSISPLHDRRSQLKGRLIVFRDVTLRKQAEAELNRRVQQLMIMRQVNDEISSTLSMDYVVNVALDAALRLSGASAGFIALVEQGDIKVINVVGNYSPKRKRNRSSNQAQASLVV